MEIKHTARGLGRDEFLDRSGGPCSIQESSSGTERCLWLGRCGARMHLTQALAAELIPLLRHFVETGRLPAREQTSKVFSISAGPEKEKTYRYDIEVGPEYWHKHSYYVYADLSYTYFKLHVGSAFEADDSLPIKIRVEIPTK